MNTSTSSDSSKGAARRNPTLSELLSKQAENMGRVIFVAKNGMAFIGYTGNLNVEGLRHV